MDRILISETDGEVTTLTLNRPEKRNALSSNLVEAMIDSLDQAPKKETRLIVIRGNGKAFCSGFDFTALESQSDGDLALRFIRLEILLQKLYYAPFTTLALVHGGCFGAGADIASSCWLRVASPDARFRMPGLQFGVSLGTRRLAEIVGVDHARQLLQASPVFDASEAMRYGFIQEIAKPDRWPDAVSAAHEKIRNMPALGEKLLHTTIRPDRGDADLASLSRSVACPGLRKRIQLFLSESNESGPPK